MMNSELRLACIVFGRERFCWYKGFLPLRSKLSEPIASNNDEGNGKPEKKYTQQILDGENGSFIPLVYITNGGMSTELKQFYRRFSQLLYGKSDVSYSDFSAWVKQQISLNLLRTYIICIKGSRWKMCNIPTEEWMELDVANRVVDVNKKLR